MKPVTGIAAAALLLGTFAASADAELHVNLNVGVPPVVVQPAPPPVVYAPTPAPEPEVYFDTAPQFIFSPALGFYVAVGVPYDVVYIGNRYYLNRGGYWYSAPYYNGPWVVTRRGYLPPGLRRHRFEEIRYYRDVEYRGYMRDREHYRGRWHAPRERYEERHEHRDHERGEHGGDRGERGHWERR
jgi:hypothetical protein